MRTLRLSIGAFVLMAAFLPGCVSSKGVIPFSNGSSTGLSGNNYTVVRTNLRGEATCGYIFGIFPVGDTAVATRAMDQLVQSAEATGKSVGLVNFAGDEVSAHYIFYKVSTVVMRADAVEFE